MKNFIVLVALVVLAAPASAVTYKWVDDRGTVNFTEDLGNVPAKYRKKVKIVGEEEPAAEEAVTEDAGKGRKKAPAAETKGEEKEAAPSVRQEKKKILYGAKDADAWRKDYAIIKADLRAAEEQLDENRSRLQDTSKMSRGEYLGILNTNKALENRIAGLRKKMDELKQSASAAGVPADVLE